MKFVFPVVNTTWSILNEMVLKNSVLLLPIYDQTSCTLLVKSFLLPTLRMERNPDVGKGQFLLISNHLTLSPIVSGKTSGLIQLLKYKCSFLECLPDCCLLSKPYQCLKCAYLTLWFCGIDLVMWLVTYGVFNLCHWLCSPLAVPSVSIQQNCWKHWMSFVTDNGSVINNACTILGFSVRNKFIKQKF